MSACFQRMSYQRCWHGYDCNTLSCRFYHTESEEEFFANYHRFGKSKRSRKRNSYSSYSREYYKSVTIDRSLTVDYDHHESECKKSRREDAGIFRDQDNAREDLEKRVQELEKEGEEAKEKYQEKIGILKAKNMKIEAFEKKFKELWRNNGKLIEENDKLKVENGKLKREKDDLTKKTNEREVRTKVALGNAKEGITRLERENKELKEVASSARQEKDKMDVERREAVKEKETAQEQLEKLKMTIVMKKMLAEINEINEDLRVVNENMI